jgi:hypothetical protein
MGGKFELHHSRDGQSQSPQTMGPQGLGNQNAGSYKQAGSGMNHSFAQIGGFHLPNKNNFARLAFTANNFYDAKGSLHSNGSTVN